MMDELVALAIVVVAILGAILMFEMSGHDARTQKAIQELVNKGVDPIKARCAIEGFTQVNMSVCSAVK